MELEYDELKRDRTLAQRGLDFALAGQVFAGLHFTVEDQRFNYGETRFQFIGLYGDVIVMVVWTPRKLARRIISMRRCDDDERQAFQRRRSGVGP